jgi:hypothetical protein
MIKFTIVNESLQISRGGTNVLFMPTLYIGVDSLSLYDNEPTIVLYNIGQSTSSTVFEGFLSDCTDANGTTFTVSTFLNFVATYFGTTSNSPSNDGLNGTTPYKLISTASTNANNVKSSAGNLYSIVAIGLTTNVRYLKLYNKATAPSVGTDVPVMTIPVPTNSQGAGISIPFSIGVNFTLGIGVALTSGSADNDTGVIGAGDVILNLTYA